MAIFSRKILLSMIFMFIVGAFILGFAKDAAMSSAESKPDTSITNAEDEYKLSGLADLENLLKNGKPTLAYFYQSVACSCVAAQCALAGTVIDSVTELQGNLEGFNFARVDVFYTDAADSLYYVDIVPVFVYYNDKGREINRLEWDVSADLLRQLINNPEKELKP